MSVQVGKHLVIAITVAALLAVPAAAGLLPGSTCSAAPSRANPPGTTAQKDPSAEDDDGGKTIIDRYHRGLSEELIGMADWLDSFFDADRSVAEENETRLRIKVSSLLEEHADPDFSIKANLRLSLPKTERRLNLLISGEPGDDLTPDNTPAEDRREEFESTDEQNLMVSLQYRLKETLRRNISTNVGVRFSRTTPVFYAEGRYRHHVELDRWILRFTQSLKWFADEGLESKARFDLERPVSERFFFRTTAEGSWFEHREGLFYNFNLSFFHYLSPRRVLRYEWVNSFRTEPENRLEETVLQMRYRQRIWRNWIFYEVSPRVSFPRDGGFSPVAGIALRIEAVIGNY